ncbi:hypothetical protein [Pseudovibrio denitrificans]|uniref:hypothetical protein n=1 Tax=Pseudovibrio denitrificans TaxID=258256 RepID=UPI000ADC73D4|nr:hypothetical protein [Pseudovibrio denitrificans]
MRRWNGWGDDTHQAELADFAKALIAELLGETKPLPDASLQEALERVPPSRAPDHPYWTRLLKPASDTQQARVFLTGCKCAAVRLKTSQTQWHSLKPLNRCVTSWYGRRNRM